MLQRTILIADSDEGASNRLAGFLRDHDFQVNLTYTANETLKRVKQHKPNLLIMDLALPDLRGEDLARIFKTDPVLVDIPIIVLTSESDVQTKVKCFDIGVDEFFVKPMEAEELLVRIKRFFKLMHQWKHTSGSASTSVLSSTTADINIKTNPTVGVPEAQPGKISAAAQSVLPKADKAFYGVYRIEGLAGSGGMGLVYKAHDQALDRYVAVKVLSKEWASVPEFVTRFRKEARLIAAINHPGIAQIYTFAEEDGNCYFALQWCPGGSLANRIKTHGRLELLPALDIILQCADALQAAFNKGVAHRDIKPSNLMFDENQQIRIVDFGIASSEKMPDSDSSIVGSPAYVSPEQGRGKKIDHRTDIYSLGITFYQMLYNRLPFTAGSAQEYLEKHATAPFPAFDSLGGKVPEKAYKIIEKMTQKSPMMRYLTYSELIKELERLRNELYSQRRLKISAATEVPPGPDFTASVFFDLLSEVFRSRKTGIVKVSWGNLEKRFYVSHNEIVHFQSPQKDENCWALLVNRKLMKKEDIPSESEGLEESLNRLLSLAAFKPEDFKSIWRELMMQSLSQVFLWPVFHGEFYECRIEHDPLARILLSRALIEAVHSLIPLWIIENDLSSDPCLVRTPEFEQQLKFLNLPLKDNFLASRVEGHDVHLETLRLLTGFSREAVLRTVYLLKGCGVLKYESGSATRRQRTAEKSLPGNVIAPPVVSSPVKGIIEQKREDTKPQNAKPAAERKWLDAAPQPDKNLAAHKFGKAQALYQAGEYNEAARLCAAAIKNNSDIPDYHYLMGRVLTHFPHSTNAASDSFRQAIALKPSSFEYRWDFIEFLKERSQIEKAFEECKKLLEIAPHDKKVSVLLRELELER